MSSSWFRCAGARRPTGGFHPPDPLRIFKPRRSIAAFLAICLGFSAQAQFASSLIFRAGDDQIFANPGDVQAETVLLADGSVGVSLQMEGLLRYQFEQLTANHVGNPMAVILCGRTLINPVVTERISSGQVSLPAPTLDMADRVSDVISGRAGCARLDP